MKDVSLSCWDLLLCVTMDRVMNFLLQLLLLYVFVLVNTTSAEYKSAVFKFVTSGSVTLNHEPKWRQSASTIMMCSHQCMVDHSCVSVLYNVSTAECSGFHEDYSENLTVSLIPSHYLLRMSDANGGEPPYCVASLSCPSSYTYEPSICLCYRVETVTTKNHADADVQCQSEGGHLLRVTSSQIQAYLESNLVASLQDLFVDGKDDLTEGTWYFSNGDVISGYFWHPGNPNVYYDTVYDCLILDGTSKKWKNFECSLKLSFICQIDVIVSSA